jgi:hypothetical protein
LPCSQAFKQQLSQDPAALEQLLQQCSCVPPDAPGPLQRLQLVIDKHLEQLVDVYRQAGCDEVEALHAALHGLQQVSRSFIHCLSGKRDTHKGVGVTPIPLALG